MYEFLSSGMYTWHYVRKDEGAGTETLLETGSAASTCIDNGRIHVQCEYYYRLAISTISGQRSVDSVDDAKETCDRVRQVVETGGTTLEAT